MELNPRGRSMGALKMRQKLEARQAEEEDIMTRVPLSRDQVRGLELRMQLGLQRLFMCSPRLHLTLMCVSSSCA